MASGSTSLTQEEVDYITMNVLSKRIVDRGEINALDRLGSPTIDYLSARTKEVGPPVNDGFRFYVKGKRGQRIQWWDGADLLVFENKHTVTDMQFDVGRGHMGYELLYQFIERQGIKVDYRKGIREKGAAPASTLEVVWNIVEQHLDDVMDDWKTDLRKRFWRANTDQPKAFAGVDALFPATSNLTGSIGGRARSNPLFRHQLVTGITKSNFMLSFFKLVKAAQRRTKGKKVEIFALGDYMWELLADLFSGTDTVAGKFDYRSTRDMAMKKGEKYNVALPQECFMYEDSLFYLEPAFREELDVEEPSASPIWEKRMYGFTPNNFGLIPVMDEEIVNHGMPYNQRLERSSVHGEWALWCNQPNGQFVGVAA